MDNGERMTNEGGRADRYEEGFTAGVDSMRAQVAGSYDDGFNAGQRTGYEEGYEAALRLRATKAPSEFAEPFGSDTDEDT